MAMVLTVYTIKIAAMEANNMMKKNTIRLASLLLVSVVGVAMAGQAIAAEWYPSRTQSEVEVVEDTTTTSTGETIVVTDAPVVESSGEVQLVEEAEEAIIQVTPVSATLAANAALAAANPNATAEELAAMATGSGLTYAANGQLNNLYNQVMAAESTEQLLQATAPAAAAEMGEAAAQYAPIALYDIAASSAAEKAIAESGNVQIAIAVPGVAEGTELMVVCWDRNGNSYVVPAQVVNGVVYLSVRTSGPVMIMARVQA